MNREAIKAYISSSEFNRLKKHGVNLFESRNIWLDVLDESWLPRKLRRKIGHLISMDLLPITPRKIIGVNHNLHKEFQDFIIKQLMDAEDEAILKGIHSKE